MLLLLRLLRLRLLLRLRRLFLQFLLRVHRQWGDLQIGKLNGLCRRRSWWRRRSETSLQRSPGL